MDDYYRMRVLSKFGNLNFRKNSLKSQFCEMLENLSIDLKDIMSFIYVSSLGMVQQTVFKKKAFQTHLNVILMDDVDDEDD